MQLCVARDLSRLLCAIQALRQQGEIHEQGQPRTVRGKDRKLTFARLDEDYICDFSLVSRRTLTDFEYEIFRNHFLLGADWRLCCRQMKIDRGTFFHSVYRIQQKLGRVFRELEPYSLFPLDEYFAGKVQKNNVTIMPKPSRPQPVQPPLLRSA